MLAAALAALIIFAPAASRAQEATENPLAPLKTDSPRDTMRAFMESMDAFRRGRSSGDGQQLRQIHAAVRCFDPAIAEAGLDSEQAEQAAIDLKETIDRIIVVQYDRIPLSNLDGSPLKRWRLRNTEISIVLMESGDRAGEYLFSVDTVRRAGEFFARTEHLPYLPGSGGGAGYRRPWLQRYAPAWLRSEFAGVFWWQWAAIMAAIPGGLLLRLLVRLMLRSIQAFASRSRFQWDHELAERAADPASLLAAVGLWALALQLLGLSGLPHLILKAALQIVGSISVIWLFYRATDVVAASLKRVAAGTESTLDDQLVPLVARSLKVFVLLVGGLAAIQNLGINVMSLLAGLGLGGLAFALAARDTVANFFGSLVIFVDRPFQLGDWIVVGGQEGTVEEIGFRSTRIRTFYNSLVSVPNSEIANAKIDNMGRRDYRRTVAKLGLVYDTSAEQMEAFLEGCKNIIKANAHTRKDYYQVVFSEWGDSALVVMLYFFLKSPDWSRELYERQNVYLEVLRLAHRIGVSFAFPTQTIHVEQSDRENPAKAHTPEHLRTLAAEFGPGGKRSRPQGQGLFTPIFRE
ncbi:MAG: mechanosensitive ion channel family protein [Leptospirales bacterium]|nr:mechanosensitive ion channel family protein [Leptospirales bacterium]